MEQEIKREKVLSKHSNLLEIYEDITEELAEVLNTIRIINLSAVQPGYCIEIWFYWKYKVQGKYKVTR